MTTTTNLFEITPEMESEPISPAGVRVCDALKYAQAEWPVFPCGRDKKPLTSHGFKDASKDPAQIFEWWGREQDIEGLGVATGPASGFWALDVDLPHGPAALEALEREYGPLPDTVSQVTGGGGKQLFFRYPADGPEIRNSAKQIGQGIDVRGDGGYVIVPPSWHASGKCYAWTPGGGPDQKHMAEAPEWLLKKVKKRDKSAEDGIRVPDGGSSTAYGKKALTDEIAALEGVRPGERNEGLNRAAFTLGQLVGGRQIDRGQVQAALLRTAKNLGLSEREAQATIRSGLEAGVIEPRGPENTTMKQPMPEEEWEPNLRPWPELKPVALSGLAGEFVRLACRDSEADPAAVLVTFLARFGIEAGLGPYVRVGEAKHPARLFAVVVGSSSKARKGTSGQPVERLFDFRNTYGHIPAHRSPGPLSTGEGLIYRVRDAVEEWQVDKKTGEGRSVVVDPGEENKRLFVLDEELAAALNCTHRDGNTLSTVMRTFWDTGCVEPLTKTARTKTTGAHVGVLTHITLAELNGLLAETEVLNGFANRFLWVCARRRKYVPIPEAMPQAEVELLQLHVLGALEFCQEPRQLDFSPEARGLWIDAYPALTQDHTGLAGAVINRGEAQVLRLSLIYALLDRADHIGLSHLQAALAFWDYCRDSALLIFGGKEADQVAQRVVSALEEGPLTATELYKVFANNISRARLTNALQELTASGRVSEQREPGKTKPRTVYALNEKYELYEFSPAEPEAEQDNSYFSDNSSIEIKNSDLWPGPRAVVL